MECCCEFCCCSKPALKKRLGIAKVVSYAQIVAATIFVIWYAFVENTEQDCRPDHSTDRNATKICYELVKKETYPVLLKLGFGLLGVILGNLLNRLAHLFEELCHCKSRYDGNCCRVLKACFSGINKSAVVVVIVVIGIAISVPLTQHATAGYKDYLMYILGGMGVNTLITHLLSLNSLSEVQISTILEEMEIHVANVLAWNYYFNFVVDALKKFQERFCSGTCSSQPNVELSLNKLLLLIFPDGIAINDLSEVDSKIERRTDISTAGLPLYCITSGEEEYLLVVQNVKEPLVSLTEIFGRNKKLDEHDINYQVKLFIKTLSDLLVSRSTNSFRDMCIVVPIIGKGLDSLKDGKLADLIIEQAKGAKPIDKADISNGPPTSNGPSTSSGSSTSNGSQLEPEDSSEGDEKPNSNLLRRSKHFQKWSKTKKKWKRNI